MYVAQQYDEGSRKCTFYTMPWNNKKGEREKCQQKNFTKWRFQCWFFPPIASAAAEDGDGDDNEKFH